MRVLLLSAYAAASHQDWQCSLQDMFPDWDWRALTLPPRHFNWRLRGNALYWAVAERNVLEERYDLVVATSAVDLATLRGLVPALAGVPTLVYFHENQFAYPTSERQQGLLEAQVTSLYTALAADRVAFNSAYNRDSFLGGCADLLNRLPDYVPPGVVEALRQRSEVLPVPVTGAQVIEPAWPGRSSQASLRLVWAGRFEYDRGGEGLLAILEELEARHPTFELALVGQRFRRSPKVFDEIQRRFEHRLVHVGYLPKRKDYLSLLAGAELVLSTSRHEFQGLAIMQAVLAGCVPVLPDRLAYPEFFPAEFLYRSCPEQPQWEAQSGADLVLKLAERRRNGELVPPDLAHLSPGRIRDAYVQLFSELRHL